MPVCTHCNSRSFVNDDALRQHLKSSNAHPFCHQCNRHFINEKAYEAHMAARHPPTFDCVKCARTFRSQTSLEDHYRGSPEHPNCSRCGKGFKNKRSMEEHYGTQHALVSCPCGLAVLFLDELDEHYLTSDMHPSCAMCNRGFKDNESHKEHLASNHGNLYCAPCTAYFETLEALSDHYFNSPGHPSCMTCSKGFRGDQEFSLHLAAEHATSPTVKMSPRAKISVIGPIQRSSIPIRRPTVRVDSPALSVCPGFGSPLLEVKAPNFSPTVLPPPGGVVNELWAMRENMEIPALPRLTATNVFASLADGPLRRKMERRYFSSFRESSSSLTTAEPSPLNNLYVTAEQDADEVYSQFHTFDHYPFMQESDPIVPLERGVINTNNTKIVGSGVRDKQNSMHTGFQPFSSPRSRASTSIQSFSPESGSTLHTLASPTSSTSGSVSSNDIPFVVSSPVLSSFFQASERRSTEKAHDLLLSAMATHMELLPESESHNTVDPGLLSVSECIGSSPTGSSILDVSSPLDLAALSNISPLATTMPIERLKSEQSKSGDALIFPEVYYPLPESPCGATSATCDVDGDSGTSDTLVLSVIRSISDDSSSMMTVNASVTPAASSVTRLQCMTPVDAILASPDRRDTMVSSDPVTSMQSLAVTNSTSDNVIPVLQHTTEKLTLSSDNPAEYKPTAVESPPDPAIPGQNPSLRPLHCRLCQLDICDDPTATMCGHLFCYKCITNSVINSPSCPVCATPTLLYCLFRLALWS